MNSRPGWEGGRGTAARVLQELAPEALERALEESGVLQELKVVVEGHQDGAGEGTVRKVRDTPLSLFSEKKPESKAEALPAFHPSKKRDYHGESTLESDNG